MAAEIFDVFVPVNVPLVRTSGVLNVHRVRLEVPADVRDPLCSAVLWLVHAERESEASSPRRGREFSMPSAERYGRPSGVPCEL